jgi:phage tail-like protein
MPSETPISAARFGISVDGHEIGRFSEVASAAGSLTVLRGSDESTLMKVLMAKPVPPAIALRRPRTNEPKLQAWCRAKQSTIAARKNCTLVLYDTAGSPVARYTLTNAWPSKLEIGGFKAGGSVMLMETVTIVADHIQRL